MVIVFCVLYLIFAFRQLGEELSLTPEWTVSISNTTLPREDDKMYPYRLGQNIGFFTEDGRITSFTSYAFKATISDSFYAAYGADNTETQFFDNRGQQAGLISEKGFPFFDKDRLYLFLPGGTSFARCDESGKTVWQYESYAPITAFSSSEGGTVAGFADGTVVAFTNDGKVNQKFAPGGSDVSVTLGVGISADGNTIACISGRNRQRFVIAQKTSESHSKIIFHEYLPKDYNGQSLVQFNKSGNTVYFNFNGGLGIADLTELKSHHVPLEGHIVQIEESDTTGLVCILSRNGESYNVTILEPMNHPLASHTFKANCAFIKMDGDALYIGRDDKISRVTVVRK